MHRKYIYIWLAGALFSNAAASWGNKLISISIPNQLWLEILIGVFKIVGRRGIWYKYFKKRAFN